MPPDIVGFWLLDPVPSLTRCYSNMLMQLFRVWFYCWYIWLSHHWSSLFCTKITINCSAVAFSKSLCQFLFRHSTDLLAGNKVATLG